MQFKHQAKLADETRLAIAKAYRMDEKDLVIDLLDYAQLEPSQLDKIKLFASDLVNHVRKARLETSGIDSFLHQYSLSSEEGVAMMCLAEAMLRVPDKATIDELIKDKLSGPNWKAYLGQSSSLFVNATTWALMLTGKILEPAENHASKWSRILKRTIGRSSEGVIRAAVAQAMKIMSKQFVMGRDIKEAAVRAKTLEDQGYCYSYDMLGEAAMTQQDAEKYFKAYMEAVERIGQTAANQGIKKGAGVSIKLSALYPRYEVAKKDAAIEALSDKLLQLAQKAKSFDIGLTVDAEEADRLELSLDIIEKVYMDPSLEQWEGFGLAVQSYQKRAFYVLDWVADLARRRGRRIMIRLIKGAYWDTEIKLSQMEGLDEYPVFTYKTFTDVSFQACAKKLFKMTDAIYPQFATHNAYSVALVLELAGDYRDFEFQCLHGMGTELYSMITPKGTQEIPCRIYAPVGSHEDLLPYLVRRLLENGANSSFVNRIVDADAPIDDLVAAPIVKAKALLTNVNEKIPLPKNIFGAKRANSSGIDLSSYQQLIELEEAFEKFNNQLWSSEPLIAEYVCSGNRHDVFSPADQNVKLGEVMFTPKDAVSIAIEKAKRAENAWQALPVEQRAKCLLEMAELLEKNKIEAYALLIQEAGKVIQDAIAEVREAVDFCRYYAEQANNLLANPIELKGYTGETNILSYHGRGTLLCISPWNFPLAIFLGQIAASLVTGNCVIAKPAEQTSLIATFATKLFHQAGIPQAVFQLLPGEGHILGPDLVADERINGVIFTGSTQTAQLINRGLASRQGAIVPIVAETGGQNAMIVDSSALLEQVVADVVQSSFGSAGQRCSALRVLYIQQDIYEKFKNMLVGAMEMLELGLPNDIATDIGPVIDQDALSSLQAHKTRFKDQILYQSMPSSQCSRGFYIEPTVIELSSILQLEQEQFGPILHLIPYEKKALDTVIHEINQTGYGLTLGIHSRVEDNVEYIASRVHVGNCYINRNMIGAVVGLQPFGGEGKSGTGPKAGGPNYLLRLCHERTISIDTTAAGGNASLMAQATD